MLYVHLFARVFVGVLAAMSALFVAVGLVAITFYVIDRIRQH